MRHKRLVVFVFLKHFHIFAKKMEKKIKADSPYIYNVDFFKYLCFVKSPTFLSDLCVSNKTFYRSPKFLTKYQNKFVDNNWLDNEDEELCLYLHYNKAISNNFKVK